MIKAMYDRESKERCREEERAPLQSPFFWRLTLAQKAFKPKFTLPPPKPTKNKMCLVVESEFFNIYTKVGKVFFNLKLQASLRLSKSQDIVQPSLLPRLS